jgi:hypothetical protein
VSPIELPLNAMDIFIYLTHLYAAVSGEPVHSAEIQTNIATITVHRMKQKR